MSMRKKMLLLALMPTLAMFLITSFLTVYELNQISAMSLDSSRETLLEAEKLKLKNLIESAKSSVQPILSDASLSRDEKARRVKELLSHIKFGDDGYLFAYDSKGVRRLLGSSDKGLGESFMGLKDTDGA